MDGPDVLWRPRLLAFLLLFFALMVALGALPGEAESLSARFGDKLLHALAYGMMATICFYVPRTSAAIRVVFTLGVIALLGLADEAIQSLLPYRNASLSDWWFDIGTAAIVASVLALLSRINPSMESHAKN